MIFQVGCNIAIVDKSELEVMAGCKDTAKGCKFRRLVLASQRQGNALVSIGNERSSKLPPPCVQACTSVIFYGAVARFPSLFQDVFVVIITPQEAFPRA